MRASLRQLLTTFVKQASKELHKSVVRNILERTLTSLSPQESMLGYTDIVLLRLVGNQKIYQMLKASTLWRLLHYNVSRSVLVRIKLINLRILVATGLFIISIAVSVLRSMKRSVSRNT